MNLSLRRRLLTVTALAAVACAGALFAVLPLVRSSQDQRLERARDLAERMLDRTLDPTRERDRDRGNRTRRERTGEQGQWRERSGGTPLPRGIDGAGGRRGLRKVWSGRLDANRRVPAANAVPSDLRALIEQLATHAPATGTSVRNVEVDDGEAAVAVARSATGEIAFAAAILTEPAEAVRWRAGVLVLAAATLLLVIASMHALVAIGRGTRTLSSSLSALAMDLGAPVVRPRVQELANVGDGIAELAARLRRSRHEETRLSSELAQQAHLAALGRVAAGVAREVRNPLAAIKLRVDLLRLGDVSPEAAHDLGDVASEVERLDRLVADLLVITGRRVLRREPTNLAALVRARVELLGPWAEERDVQLSCRGEARADIDQDSITRVIDNLIRNAVEASPTKSEVIVNVSSLGAETIVAVLDRGPGIPADNVANVFEPFFTTKAEGTGLGLALCRSLAAAHDGEIRYRRVGDRTRFELRLPTVAVR